jgi:hypothetical protein
MSFGAIIVASRATPINAAKHDSIQRASRSKGPFMAALHQPNAKRQPRGLFARRLTLMFGTFIKARNLIQ